MLPRQLLRATSSRSLPPSVLAQLARTYAVPPPKPSSPRPPPAPPAPSSPSAPPTPPQPSAESMRDPSYLMDPNDKNAASPWIRWLVKRFKIDVSAVREKALAQKAAQAAQAGGPAKPDYAQMVQDSKDKVAAKAASLSGSSSATTSSRSASASAGSVGVKKQEPASSWTKLVTATAPPAGSGEYKQKDFNKMVSPAVSYTAQAVLIFLIWLAGVLYPPDIGRLISPRIAPPAPTADSKKGKEMVKAVETELQNLAVVKEYRKLAGWYECRPYTTLPEYAANHSLTAGTLRGPSKLAVAPLVFAKDDESEAIVIIHLGRSLCGHDGIVHGGMVGTILDEATGRNALLNLPTKIGVTANLNINYRAPTKADQFVVIKTKLTQLKARKAVVSAEMWTLAGEQLADATAVYVEPKWAALLKGSGVEELLGKRPEGGPPRELGVKPSVLGMEGHGTA